MERGDERRTGLRRAEQVEDLFADLGVAGGTGGASGTGNDGAG
jgi:hypothetical protein